MDLGASLTDLCGLSAILPLAASTAMQRLSELPQQLANGILLGSVYALIALGYTMVYGVLRFINFAHGDVLMVGAYMGMYTAIYLATVGLGPANPMLIILVLLAAMVGCALLGMFIEATAYRPLRKRPRLTVLITAIGVSLFLEYMGQTKYLFGPTPKPFPDLIVRTKESLLPFVYINNVQLITFMAAIALMLLLSFIAYRTRMGMAMRALSQNPTACSLMGVNTNVIISFTFGLGSALAGAAAILNCMNNTQVDPLMGIPLGIKAFVAAVVGGIGNIPGAALGALIIGILETMVVAYISPTYKDAVAFALLILILLIKPSGILGKAEVVKV